MVYFGLDTVAETSVEIPNRAAFKASEVCEIAQIPSYVLRSWEKEFPGLGAAARPGGPRIYRRTDIEQILRIKQLVFAEGLTLAGARRRLEGDPPPEDDPILTLTPVPDEVRSRVSHARRELRSLLDMLSEPARDVPEPQPPPGPADPRLQTTQMTDPPTWPPSGSRQAQETMGHQEEESGTALPLLEGVMDSPQAPRRGRRPAKGPHGSRASKVE